MYLDPRSTAVVRDLRDPEGVHTRIMGAFPSVLDPEQKARAYFGVLYRLEDDRRSGRLLLYVQSHIKPDWSILSKGYLADMGMENPAVKEIDPAYAKIGEGRRLRFRLRANPTRKIDTKSGPDGQRNNGRRVPLHGPEAQVAWLARQGTRCGFELVRATIASAGAAERIHGHASGRTFQGVMFEGQLVVRDPARFRASLVGGIGPGKAYGFGLLSVGPA